MINLIGLCRHIKDLFPNPVKSDSIKLAVLNYLGSDPTYDVQIDLVKVIFIHWKRNGWTWSETGAVQLDEDEDVLFHDKGLTFIKTGENIPGNMIALMPVSYTDSHPRVIWFK